MKLDDLTGKKFGRLTVLRRATVEDDPMAAKHTVWVCECDCGNIATKSAIGLKNYRIPSCGCAEKEARSLNRFEDLTGKRFGRLTVMYRANKPGEITKWHCRCDCGNEVDVFAGNLKRKNHSTSCGCYQEERRSEVHTTHGYSNTRIAQVFSHMKDRCNNPNNPRYPSYGGRGIKICPEWEDNPAAFYEWAYANGFREDAEYGETTIERNDNNRGYSPENCSIKPLKDQANNRRTSLFITHNGVTKTLAQWRDLLGMTQNEAYRYIVKKKYTIQRLIDEGIVNGGALSI